MIAGMDFGTTHSGMSVYDGQQLRTLPLNLLTPGDRVTPTVLYITNEQQIEFGREATTAYFEQNLGRPSKLEKIWVGEISQTFAELPTFIRDVYIWVDVLSPGRLFLSFKSDLSDASYAGTAIGRFFYSLEQIATTYLYIAKRRAEQALGRELDEIVLGRPVRFHHDPDADRLAQARLLEAALQAGYRRVYFEYEPVAAAYFYETTLKRPQNVLIFDFGGGTLDITIMRLGEGKRQVLATGGVPIAGDVFDRKIVRAKLPRLFGEGSLYRSHDKKLPVPGWIYDAFNDWRSLLALQQPEQLNTLRTIAPVADQRRAFEALIQLVTSNYSLKLFETVETVKRRLSESDTAVIRLLGDGFAIREPITRVEFETLIRPEYNIIERQLDETVQRSGLRANEIDIVIRTGGSSQIPLFQRMLAEKFGAEKVQAIDTFGSVTAGLGVIAHQIHQGRLDLPGYSQSTRQQSATTPGRTHIPPINLDLLKQQIDWQHTRTATTASQRSLLLLSSNYELSLSELAIEQLSDAQPLAWQALALPEQPNLMMALAPTLDEPLLLLTSNFRLLLVTSLALLQQQAAGVDFAHLYGLERGEQLCAIQRWEPLREQELLLLVSTQGYVRKFDLSQLRPVIEGPTPARLDWTLPGWPRVAVAATSADELALITKAGRGVRMPVSAIRRTGTRVLHKPKADELLAGVAVNPQTTLWALASAGWTAWCAADEISLQPQGGAGALFLRRRGALGAIIADPPSPSWALTPTRLLPLDPAASQTAKPPKLGKGETVKTLLA